MPTPPTHDPADCAVCRRVGDLADTRLTDDEWLEEHDSAGVRVAVERVGETVRAVDQ